MTSMRLRTMCRLLVLAVVAIGSGARVHAQESVQLTQPSVLNFIVADVGMVAAGTPDPTTFSFSGAVLSPGRSIRISVRAEGPLTHSSGATIDAGNVTWTISNVVNGLAMNGTLATATYTDVMQSTADAQQGSVDLTWHLSPDLGVLHAGVYQATLRWKVESVAP